MNNVSIFIKTIITITFIWCIAELIIPENKIKNLSSYFYSLIIISLIITTFTNLDYNSVFQIADYDDTSSYNNEYMKSLYEEKIEEFLSKKFNDNSIDIKLNDEYLIEDIYCNNTKTYNEIMGYLND